MEKGGIYWNAWKDLFQFHKEHANEESWNKIRDDSAALEHRYRGTKAEDFVCGTLVQILLEIERMTLV